VLEGQAQIRRKPGAIVRRSGANRAEEQTLGRRSDAIRRKTFEEMIQHISQQQLESYLWGAATLLRGTIDASDDKKFIFPLLFLKRLCDVFDEEIQTALAESGSDREFALFPENHRLQVPLEAHW